MARVPFCKEDKKLKRLVKIDRFNGKEHKVRMLACDLVGEYIISKKRGESLRKIKIFNIQAPKISDFQDPFLYKFQYEIYEYARGEGFSRIKSGIMDLVSLNRLTDYSKRIGGMRNADI